MKLAVISIFPEFFQPLINCGVVGKALSSGKIQLDFFNPRDYTIDKHRRIDDTPYGGGPGMVMQAEPLHTAIQAAKKVDSTATANPNNRNSKVIYLSPQGHKLDQLILLAGRYEGIDQRVIQSDIDVECSIGDYVLSGGELPAMVLIDAICRLQPGVLGSTESAQQDSFSGKFSQGLLEYPHYTRPAEFAGMKVPEVLLSGDHAKIARWRLKQSLGKTWLNRPQWFKDKKLTVEQQQLLAEFLENNKIGN